MYPLRLYINQTTEMVSCITHPQRALLVLSESETNSTNRLRIVTQA